MNRDNEEQRPVSQTLCGALQKEANCKCLVLSVLIYGCLGAVTWCRCANVTQIVLDYINQPLKRTKQVSPCDDGYIYIPVAFMGMLYLVYLVECYHSPIRIDLLHSESQDGVLTKLAQLKLAQPTIWWKAISYHYVRRKRQITRYRNGDNYTTTQVYYERVNTHAATSFYFYEYCGVKDISKDLILDPKIPITKISLAKGFAFSNLRSATEFEEARSRFFAEQEHRDDYMEMREGLDLGHNFNPTSLIAVLGNPWFTNSYVYWCLSALLLSWPLRIIIECNTQYVDYQITKLFGVNYDTPARCGPIHTSSSQLSAPGSYMLAPSYSEALLMEPAAPAETEERVTDMVPSYSEALLYECVQGVAQSETVVDVRIGNDNETPLVSCECACHCFDGNVDSGGTLCDSARNMESSNKPSDLREVRMERSVLESSQNDLNEMQENRRHLSDQVRSTIDRSQDQSRTYGCPNGNKDGGSCSNCHPFASGETINSATLPRISNDRLIGGFRQNSLEALSSGDEAVRRKQIARENSEPNLRTSSDLLSASTQFLRTNGQSLENIMEHDETDVGDFRVNSTIRNCERAEALVLEDEEFLANRIGPSVGRKNVGRGAIPKKLETRNRVTVNPMSEVAKKIPSSRTYFCLKSILKQNRRRYTLVTTEELQGFAEEGRTSGGFEANDLPRSEGISGGGECSRDCSCDDKLRRCNWSSSRESLENSQSSRRQRFHESVFLRRSLCLSDRKRENSRTLIFASPIQEVCPNDPFGGKNLVPTENPSRYDETSDLPVLSRLRRSLTEREAPCHGSRNYRKRFRTMSIEPEYLFSNDSRRIEANAYQNGGSPSTCAEAIPSEVRMVLVRNDRLSSDHEATTLDEDRVCVNLVDSSGDLTVDVDSGPPKGKLSRLTRSLTERRRTPSTLRRPDRHLRRSFTERVEIACRPGNFRRTNLNMETSL